MVIDRQQETFFVPLEQSLRNCRRIPPIIKMLVHETMAN